MVYHHLRHRLPMILRHGRAHKIPNGARDATSVDQPSELEQRARRPRQRRRRRRRFHSDRLHRPLVVWLAAGVSIGVVVISFTSGAAIDHHGQLGEVVVVVAGGRTGDRKHGWTGHRGLLQQLLLLWLECKDTYKEG